MDRSGARAAAMKLLYEWEMGGEGGAETRLGLLELKEDEPESGYMESIVSGVMENAGTLDETIQKFAIGWKLERINKIDLTILRVSTYEMLHLGLPVSVAINEAVELARAYSTPEAGAFVNGILGSLARELAL